MKKAILIVSMALLVSNPAFAQPPNETQETQNTKDRQEYIQQQMVLMGLYVYGLKKEVEKKKIDYDELEFLADSLLDIAGKLKETKEDAVFHKNLSDLLKNAQDLKTFSQTDHAKAKMKAKAVLDSCRACHANH